MSDATIDLTNRKQLAIAKEAVAGWESQLAAYRAKMASPESAKDASLYLEAEANTLRAQNGLYAAQVQHGIEAALMLNCQMRIEIDRAAQVVRIMDRGPDSYGTRGEVQSTCTFAEAREGCSDRQGDRYLRGFYSQVVHLIDLRK